MLCICWCSHSCSCLINALSHTCTLALSRFSITLLRPALSASGRPRVARRVHTEIDLQPRGLMHSGVKRVGRTSSGNPGIVPRNTPRGRVHYPLSPEQCRRNSTGRNSDRPEQCRRRRFSGERASGGDGETRAKIWAAGYWLLARPAGAAVGSGDDSWPARRFREPFHGEPRGEIGEAEGAEESSRAVTAPVGLAVAGGGAQRQAGRPVASGRQQRSGPGSGSVTGSPAAAPEDHEGERDG
ncbi:hypothetical protein NL676_029489 [Syzygium grande]|nr:hypothetical protein NL676_029489 [Syzygium grande]